MARELFTKIYTRINWRNRSEAMTTPLGKTLLNRLDYTLDETDSRIAALDVLKAEESEVLQMVKEWSMNEETGIITVTKKNGEKIMFDLNIEKIPVSFTLSSNGILTMTTDDGTKFTADIGSMIPVLTFKASDTVSVTVEGTGINKTYSFSVKEGSIKDKHLQPSYLADIKVQAQAADKSAGAAQTEANRAKTEADRAKTEADRAKTAAESAGALGAVTGIKGNKETAYRQGNVNLTPANIGALPDGTVPVNKGGTGATVASSAMLNLLKGLSYFSGTALDNLLIPVTDAAIDTAAYRKGSDFWAYIKNKINAATDIKATQDSLGNVIADTYLEKMYFSPHANFAVDSYEMAETININTGITKWGSTDYDKINKGVNFRDNVFLIIGTGSSSNSTSAGADDFFRISLIFPMLYADNSSDTGIFKEVVLATSGSTARYTFAATKNVYSNFSIKIPKGAYASGAIYRMITKSRL